MHIPPVLQMVLWGAAAWAIDRFVPFFHYTLHQQGGLVLGLFCIGAGLCVAGVLQFLRFQTTVNPMAPGEAETIVTTGIYRLSRNPMYLGMLIILLSWVLSLGNILALATLPGFIALITITQIRPEERILSEKFGAQYDAYKRHTRRWI